MKTWRPSSTWIPISSTSYRSMFNCLESLSVLVSCDVSFCLSVTASWCIFLLYESINIFILYTLTPLRATHSVFRTGMNRMNNSSRWTDVEFTESPPPPKKWIYIFIFIFFALKLPSLVTPGTDVQQIVQPWRLSQWSQRQKNNRKQCENQKRSETLTRRRTLWTKHRQTSRMIQTRCRSMDRLIIIRCRLRPTTSVTFWNRKSDICVQTFPNSDQRKKRNRHCGKHVHTH